MKHKQSLEIVLAAVAYICHTIASYRSLVWNLFPDLPFVLGNLGMHIFIPERSKKSVILLIQPARPCCSRITLSADSLMPLLVFVALQNRLLCKFGLNLKRMVHILHATVHWKPGLLSCAQCQFSSFSCSGADIMLQQKCFKAIHFTIIMVI